MLSIPCDVCGKELENPGALLFGPPVNKVSDKVHICCQCYKDRIKPILSLSLTVYFIYEAVKHAPNGKKELVAVKLTYDAAQTYVKERSGNTCVYWIESFSVT